MANVLLRSFADLVAPSVPGCTITSVKRAVLNAAIDLCQRAGIWHYEPDVAITLEIGKPLQAVEAPAGAEVYSILALYVDGVELCPLPENRWPREAATGTPRNWRFVEPGEVRLWPTPDSAASMTFRATLCPVFDAQDIPAFLMSHHRQTIAAGALSELQRIPGKQWSDLQSAAINQQVFMSGVNEARIRENQGGTNVSLRVRPVRMI
jgi:hypothetical protein